MEFTWKARRKSASSIVIIFLITEVEKFTKKSGIVIFAINLIMPTINILNFAIVVECLKLLRMGICMDKELTLWEISEELEKCIDQATGEIGNDSTLQELLTKKTDTCCVYIEKQQDLAELAAQKIKELRAYQSAREHRVESFKGYIMAAMRRMGVESLRGDISELKIKKNPPHLVIFDEKAVPPQFVVAETIVSIKKNELKEWLKSNPTDGLNLVQDETITIKRKI